MQRKDIPQHLKQVLLVSKYLTLYLVASQPPKYFTFVDPLNNYFKVVIDRRVSCSCLPGNKDHCMHTFYVLTRVYQMSQQDPLIYQNEYTEEQLEEIFKGGRAKRREKEKEEIKVEKKIEEKVERQVEKIEPKKQTQKQSISNKNQTKIKQNLRKEVQTFIKSLQQPQSTTTNNSNSNKLQKIQTQIIPKQQYQQPNLQKGSMCSICYETLQGQKPLLKCPSQCFSYFHIKCLKFWIQFKKKEETNATCPMCRGKLPQNMSQVLKKSELAFVKHYQSFEINCSECGEEIKFKLFRCLLCKQCNTCEQCFFSWKHLSHDRYLMKKSKKAQWSCPQTRNQASMAKLDVSLKYVKQFKNQQEMKILFGQNYSKFLQANLKKETMLEYIVNSFVSVSKEIYKTYKKLDYEQKDIKCLMCKKGKVTEMRRLNCKHFIDEKCLTFLLLNGERNCPLDKVPFLEAFNTLTIKITKK